MCFRHSISWVCCCFFRESDTVIWYSCAVNVLWHWRCAMMCLRFASVWLMHSNSDSVIQINSVDSTKGFQFYLVLHCWSTEFGDVSSLKCERLWHSMQRFIMRRLMVQGEGDFDWVKWVWPANPPCLPPTQPIESSPPSTHTIPIIPLMQFPSCMLPLFRCFDLFAIFLVAFSQTQPKNGKIFINQMQTHKELDTEETK